ncbi:hypothetical protein [Massilia sp. DWR3-1-1]|uniref:hypothetical protein n=1 Tax=Massilia sp. DWR3-1-1 TaxID=2804559 RepID=UPI003CEAA876
MTTSAPHVAARPPAAAAVPPASTTLAQTPVVLTLHHHGDAGAASQVVLFKKNSAAGADDAVLAWKVIRICAGQHARVVLPFSQQIGVFDPCGAHAGLHDAFAGDMFDVAAGAGTPLLARSVVAAGPNMVGVRNATAAGLLEVVLYKDGRPLCRCGAVAPATTAVFEVLPYLHVAVCPGITEGAIVDAHAVAGATRISLLGLKSADLVLTGNAGHSQFQLFNQRFS